MLYLIHESFLTSLIYYVIPFYKPFFNKASSIICAYFTILPIIFYVSLLLEKYVDAPSRNFAHNLYLSLKKNNNNTQTTNKDDKLWKFLKNDLFIKNLIMLLIFLSVVSYIAFKDKKRL